MRIAWNKGLKGEEYKNHFKRGFKGIFKKRHTSWWIKQGIENPSKSKGGGQREK